MLKPHFKTYCTVNFA